MGAGEGIHPELGVKARLTNLVEARPTMAESMPTYRLKRGLVSQSTARKVQNLHPDIWPASFWRWVVPVFFAAALQIWVVLFVFFATSGVFFNMSFGLNVGPSCVFFWNPSWPFCGTLVAICLITRIC